MGSQWWKTMIKNCTKLCCGLAMSRKNDQKLRQAMLWVCNVEKQWSKIASSYVMGWQCWETVIKNWVKLCNGYAMLRNNDRKFCQAMLWVLNVEKQWSKIASCYVMGSQCWKKNDQILRQAMLWVGNAEKQWRKFASSYVMGLQCWQLSNIASSYVMASQCLKIMIKNCLQLCYWFAVMKNNDQKLRQAIWWVCSGEKQWSKIASSYLIGSQWWKTMIRNCVKLFDGFAVVKNNDQKLRQAIWLVRNGEKQWSKIASNYLMGLQWWKTMIKNCVKVC